MRLQHKSFILMIGMILFSLSSVTAWNFDSNDVTITTLTGNFSNISQASDTDLTYPVTDNFVLTWDAATSNWIAQSAAAVGDTNETVRFEVLIGTDCVGTDKMVGVDASGAVVCATDTAVNTSYYLITNPDNYWNDTFATWNKTDYYTNATGTFALIGSGGGITWAEVVNGTVVEISTLLTFEYWNETYFGGIGNWSADKTNYSTYANQTATFALIGSGGEVTWAMVVNGTVVLQTDYDINYSANNEAWLDTTNTSYVNYNNVSNLNVNSSDNWDSYDTTNSSQISNVGGVLTILTTYLSEVFDSLFGNKDTDDLTEGSSNLYDNQSWNQSHYYKNATGTFALIGSGGGIVWADVVNGTVVLQEDYDANYSASYSLYTNRTNSTYHAYNSTGLIRDWNASGYIIDWNVTGYIKDWTGDITDSNTTLYNWILGQGYALGGTGNWSADKTNYSTYANQTTTFYLASNPDGFVTNATMNKSINKSVSCDDIFGNDADFCNDAAGEGGKTGGLPYLYNDSTSIYFNYTLAGTNLSVNESDHWDDYDTTNSTQISNTGGVLTIISTYLSEVFDSLFGNKNTDDLSEGMDNLYDNKSWSQEVYYENATGTFALIGSGGGIVWADVVNGTVVLQEDYDINYSASYSLYTNRTNSTYHAYNSTGLIRDWNVSGQIIDWNATGYIKNWTGEIIDSNITLYNWIIAQEYITWADVVNGTVMLQTTFNINYSANDEDYRSITNTSYVNYDNLSNSYVNSSDNWDSLDSTNSTQFSNTGGVLTIISTWFIDKWNAVWGTKTTDDLTEGSINLYDNQSWNESKGDQVYVNIDGDTMTGDLNLNADLIFQNFTITNISANGLWSGIAIIDTTNESVNQLLFAIEEGGTTGVTMPHFWIQNGGAGQASGISRSFMIVNEEVMLQNNSNLTSCQAFADIAGSTLQIDCNTTTTGADLLVGDDIQVFGDAWFKDEQGEDHNMNRALTHSDALQDDLSLEEVEIYTTHNGTHTIMFLNSTTGNDIEVNLDQTIYSLGGPLVNVTLLNGVNSSPQNNFVFIANGATPSMQVASVHPGIEAESIDIASYQIGDSGHIKGFSPTTQQVYEAVHGAMKRAKISGPLYATGFDSSVNETQFNLTEGTSLIIYDIVNCQNMTMIDDGFFYVNSTGDWVYGTDLSIIDEYSDGTVIAANKFMPLIVGAIPTSQTTCQLVFVTSGYPGVGKEYKNCKEAEEDKKQVRNVFPPDTVLKEEYTPTTWVLYDYTLGEFCPFTNEEFFRKIAGDVTGGGGAPTSPSTDHAGLDNLDYASSGHTGFQSEEDYDINYSANNEAWLDTTNSSYVTYTNLSNSYVNSSDNWDSFDSTNTTQISNTNGVLTILTTYLSEVFNSLFGNKDTDDLTEGSINLYDNQSWNQSHYFENATGTFALLSDGITWAMVVNGTVVLQEDYDTNYSASYQLYTNRTNSTYHAYNATGLIRDWNVSGQIIDWNASGFIIDWNATGYIKDWTGDITNSNTTLYNWIIAQGYAPGGIGNWSADKTNYSTYANQTSTFVTYNNLSNSYVNSSNNWDSYNTANTTQIGNTGGVLTILTTYLSEVFNSLFGNKDTDDLTEGSINLYDNQSWNAGTAGDIFANLSGDIFTGSVSLESSNIYLNFSSFMCWGNSTNNCLSNVTNNGTHSIWY